MNVPSYKYKNIVCVYDVSSDKWVYKLFGRRKQCQSLKQFIDDLDKQGESVEYSRLTRFKAYDVFLVESEYSYDIGYLYSFRKATMTSENKKEAWVRYHDTKEKKKLVHYQAIEVSPESEVIMKEILDRQAARKEMKERVNKAHDRLNNILSRDEYNTEKLMKRLKPAKSNITISEEVEKELERANASGKKS